MFHCMWRLKTLYEHARTYNMGVYIEKIEGEYDQEIPQSQTADKHMVQRGRATRNNHKTPGIYRILLPDVYDEHKTLWLITGVCHLSDTKIRYS